MKVAISMLVLILGLFKLANGLEIEVKTLTGNSFNLNVDPADSVELLKSKIQTEGGVPIDQQRLVFNGKLMKDGHLLTEYDIKQNSIVFFVHNYKPTPMQVFIKILNGKVFSLDLEPTDTVGQLKAKIKAKENFPIENQRLVFGGKLLEDERGLYSYNIRKHSTIIMLFNLKTGQKI